MLGKIILIALLVIVGIIVFFLLDRAHMRRKIKKQGGMKEVYSTLLRPFLSLSGSKFEKSDSDSIMVSWYSGPIKNYFGIMAAFHEIVVRWKYGYTEKRWDFKKDMDQNEMIRIVINAINGESGQKIEIPKEATINDEIEILVGVVPEFNNYHSDKLWCLQKFNHSDIEDWYVQRLFYTIDNVIKSIVLSFNYYVILMRYVKAVSKDSDCKFNVPSFIEKANKSGDKLGFTPANLKFKVFNSKIHNKKAEEVTRFINPYFFGIVLCIGLEYSFIKLEFSDEKKKFVKAILESKYGLEYGKLLSYLSKVIQTAIKESNGLNDNDESIVKAISPILEIPVLEYIHTYVLMKIKKETSKLEKEFELKHNEDT